MIINFTPQRHNDYIIYAFEPDKVLVKIETKIDVFDFSELQEGDEVARSEETGQLEIETTLPFLPILDAHRENGQVIVTVLKYHGKDAPYEERFPEPLEVV